MTDARSGYEGHRAIGASASSYVAAGILLVWALVAAGAPLFQPSQQQQALLRATDSNSISLLAPLAHGHLVPLVGRTERYTFVQSDRADGSHKQRAVSQHRFWLGTDRIGNDVAVSIARGARTSLVVGLFAALLASTVGVAVGAIAGLASPLLDAALMRLVDAMLAFPLLLLVLMLDLLFDPGLLALVLILSSAQWMGVARVVRAEMLRLRNAPFVVAARAVGARGIPLFLRHLLPNALQPILLSSLLLVGDSILLESAVSFLGFGTASELESWGRLVDAGRGFLTDAWWISAFPGLAIVMVVTALNLLGDARISAPLRRRMLWTGSARRS